MSEKIKLWFFLAAIIFLVLAGCSEVAHPVLSDEFSGAEESQGQNVRRYRLAFTGDIMVHDGQIKAAYIPEQKSYSFQGYFDDVQEFLKAPDITVGNLETTFSGGEKGYTGYPQFNTPEMLAGELAKAGFDVLTTANNHSFDRREEGVISTINNLDKWGLVHTGTGKKAAEAEIPVIINQEGLKTAFLAYTYWTNGLVVPEDKSYLVNRIDLNKIGSDIQKARDSGAELVVVGLHFGIEYQRFPGEKEKTLVRQVAEAGADLIIGTHPHVLQAIEFLDVKYQGEPKKVLTAYSLGNFVSDYRSRYKNNGIILLVDVAKSPAGQITIEGYSYIPVFVHRYNKDGRTWYRVIPVEKGIADYGKEESYISEKDYYKLKQAWQDTTTLLGTDGLKNIHFGNVADHNEVE